MTNVNWICTHDADYFENENYLIFDKTLEDDFKMLFIMPKENFNHFVKNTDLEDLINNFKNDKNNELVELLIQ